MNTPSVKRSGVRAVCGMLAAAALHAACSDDAQAPALPQRSASEVRAYVQQTQHQQHGASAAAVATVAGSWSGELLLGDDRVEVAGVATAGGLLVLREHGGTASHVVSDLVIAQGAWRGTLARSVGATVTRYTLVGPAEPGRLSMLVLPFGWSADDVANGRVPSEAERASFGRLSLDRIDAPVLSVAALAGSVEQTQGGDSAGLRIDAHGNFVAHRPGCALSGGIAASDSVAGVLEIAATASGAACPSHGLVTGAAWRMNASDAYTVIVTDGSNTRALAANWSSP